MSQATSQFLDDLVQQLAAQIAGAEIHWSEASDPLPEELLWWMANRSSEGAQSFAMGGTAGSWEEVGLGGESGDFIENGYAKMAACVQLVLAKTLGEGEPPADAGPSVEPPADWAHFVLEIQVPGQHYQFFCSLSAELEQGLAAGPEPAETPIRRGSPVSLDMLMDVEVPVRVSFGRTRIRMKELLNLNAGSVVELDRSMGDQVEIMVNRCVIARGEVVAVAGNYGVRILELISTQEPNK